MAENNFAKANKGRRKHRCADCKRETMLHWTETARRCKPRCQGCGSTFLEPCGESAQDTETRAGTARSIKQHEPPLEQRPGLAMRGEKEIPGT